MFTDRVESKLVHCSSKNWWILKLSNEVGNTEYSPVATITIANSVATNTMAVISTSTYRFHSLARWSGGERSWELWILVSG